MKDFEDNDTFIFESQASPVAVTKFESASNYEFGGMGNYGALTLGNTGVTIVDDFAEARGGGGGGGKPDKGDGGGGGGGGKGGGKPDKGGDPNLLTEYTSGNPDGIGFNIRVEFSGTWTVALQQAFIDAADFISSLILGDVPDVLSGPYAGDDITISATLTDIDGTGGVLGRAGPTVVRTSSGIPIEGIMEFDVADAEDYDGLGLFNDIVFHEMMHTLGFGSLWDYMGLTSGSIEDGDLVFTGQLANEVYASEFSGLNDADNFDFGVPIETDGLSGTAGGHWDDATFVNEIMTGYINESNYLSTMSIAALEDMGYDTVFDNPYDANDLTGAIPVTDIFSDGLTG